MKIAAVALSLAILASTWLPASAASFYRWVDAQGQVHYTDTPPPKEAKSSEQRRVDGNVIEGDKVPYAVKEAAKKHPVILYASECGDLCAKARDFLDKRGVPFTERNPAVSQADHEALKKLAGSTEVPTLVVGTMKPIKGFEAGAWTSALDVAGYPKTAPLVKPSPRKEKIVKDPSLKTPENAAGGEKPANAAPR